MTNSEYLLTAYFGKTEDDVWRDTLSDIQAVLNADDPIDAGVPDDFNFTCGG
jgi:hypothetical protein